MNNLQLYLHEAYLIKRWNEVEEKHLNSYLVHLSKYTEQKASSLRQTVSRIRRFFRWLYTSNRVLVDIAEEFQLPKPEHTLPQVPTEAAIARIIEQCDTEKAIGVRDRSILETLYATGIRHGELHRLNMRDFDGRTLRIREGKGRREREETIFVYDAGGKLIGEYSTIVQTGNNAKTLYTTNDHLGSPRINTDGVGAVISRHDYHPFG